MIGDAPVAVARLVRVHAVLTAAALALLGARLAVGVTPPAALLLIALTVALATAGGNALNDVHDREIDAVNRRDRPIPSGAITARAATVVAAGCLALAVLCAAALSPWCLAICVANVALLVAYARNSKRLGAGKGLIVGWLVGSAVLFGARSPGQVDPTLATLAACALLATFAREALKDVEDLEGDRRFGGRTLPIAIGVGPTRALAGAALALAVALSSVPWLTGAAGTVYAVLAAAGAAVFALALPAARSARTAQRLVMAGSVVEMAAFFFGAG